MSGHRWIFLLLAVISYLPCGCQVDGGTRKIWNPFARAEEKNFDDEQLPRFVRRISDDKSEKSGDATTPIAESRVESLLTEGQYALQENRIPDARRAYSEVLQFLPDDPTAHHGMAMAADLSENWAEAEEHYRQALRVRPRDANLLCDIGYSYLLQNRYSEASSYLSQAIQINPNHENAHTNLALLDVRQGNPEAARTRLMARYGDTARVTQILAALQSQSAASTPSSVAANVPFVPENATFEQVREIANRERIAAEQRRAVNNIPADHANGPGPVSVASHSHVVDQSTINTQTTGGLLNRQPMGLQPNYGAENQLAAPTFPNPAVANYAANRLPQNTGLQTAMISEAQPGNISGPSGQPAPNQPMYSNAMAPLTGAWNQPAQANPGFTSSPEISANVGQSNQPHDQSQFAQGYQSPAATASANLNGMIPVRPSGAFQPPTQGVSYGQPIGFGQATAESASYPNNNAGTSVGNAYYTNTIYGSAAQALPNTTNQLQSSVGTTNPAGAQSITASQPNSAVQLEGLNVGPGSLFPIGQNSPQNSGLKMGTVSSPGSNSVINGAMYGQPVSTLPSQDWMRQQQMHQSPAQSQSPNQNYQGYPQQGNSGQLNYSGNPGSQTPTANATSGASVGSGNPANPSGFGIQAPPANPLATYENQLRQLDNQYNNTLQQLDRNPATAMPRAQY